MAWHLQSVPRLGLTISERWKIRARVQINLAQETKIINEIQYKVRIEGQGLGKWNISYIWFFEDSTTILVTRDAVTMSFDIQTDAHTKRRLFKGTLLCFNNERHSDWRVLYRRLLTTSVAKLCPNPAHHTGSGICPKQEPQRLTMVPVSVVGSVRLAYRLFRSMDFPGLGQGSHLEITEAPIRQPDNPEALYPHLLVNRYPILTVLFLNVTFCGFQKTTMIPNLSLSTHRVGYEFTE